LRKALQDRVQLHLLSPSAADSGVHFQTGTGRADLTLKSLVQHRCANGCG
jgi:hypothetical protein